MKKALVVIDFINEIVDEKGKLAAKGYADFIKRRLVIERLNEAIDKFRGHGLPVIFIRLAFEPTYCDQPKGSPLFGNAHKYGILKDADWSTEIHPSVRRVNDDRVIRKQRVNAFHNTTLDHLLKSEGITQIYLAGVATDLAVEATARDAHDRDYQVFIIEDACGAASDEDHEESIKFLSKISKIVSSTNLDI